MATDLSTYDELLLACRPRPIRNAREHARALRQIDQLMRQGPELPRAESEMVEVLATLVEKYEETQHPTPRLSPAEQLAHLIEARGVTKAQVARATGLPRASLTNFIHGSRGLSKQSIASLAKYFQVSADVFLVPAD